MGVTAHCFDPLTHRPHHMTLSCKPFAPTHTAEAIYDSLEEVLKDWEIPHEKISIVTTDNASSMIAAFKNYVQDNMDSREAQQEITTALCDFKDLFADILDDSEEDAEILNEMAEFEAFERALMVN